LLPIWLIEAGVYGEEVNPLLREIRRQEMTGDLISYPSLQKGTIPLPSDGACVIGYGTLPFAREIQLHRRWLPGAWCNLDNLDCSVYFTHFRPFLLNQHHTILPGVDALQQVDTLFAEFAIEEEVFARPTSCHKLFNGRCIPRERFTQALAPTRYDPSTRVVIAEPREIAYEWRLVVVEDRVIAGSQYARWGERDIAPGCPEEVRSFAGSVLAQVSWRPDPIFMMDVGESAGRLGLVELNGFSCSWLYQCDLPAVIHEASALATRTWASGGRQPPEARRLEGREQHSES
jgi:hypothetical protein